ncbi:tRNA (N(6)-L-threonylcarbamoyladenosine(37)-C(2))-methylthiotransferase MtaB [Thermogemmatispora onikobensis]|uniref:tRNA (N(6)-L-threonylcarbamoyladenosine(37)-C(2))- methylthiotransferase MtaB n=1 Tax=Thermogemmatispora onikobensis TaxID=732234 RepID=UPI000852BF8E|nr:tRNA (N(6)-L-threonylcarbamoyladenosine(37)-C(2))-methylthiotransferase MtaB [Thermogemmatispora onikobensis]
MSLSERGPATFAIATLGCKVNQADSEAISEQMHAAGFVQQDFNEPADVYIVNTCTVTHLGDRSSRALIHQVQRRRPDALLVVTGCYAEANPQAVAALPGVDLVVGNSGKTSLVEAIRQRLREGKEAAEHGATTVVPGYQQERRGSGRTLPMLPLDSYHIGSDWTPDEEPLPENADSLSALTLPEHWRPPFSRTRAQIKVQDGCDNRCTYCIVPYVRGGSRSRSIASVVEQVRRKARAGYKEVVLTGVHLGDYHPPENPQQDLGHLLAALLGETPIPRIRVSSLEPEDFRLEWLELWENPRLCRHLHLPLQSGSDAVLRRMGRRYTTERYRTIVTTARRLIPDIAVSTDIITGFPGESEEDFAQTYALAAELGFARCHVFRFSPRQGTPAARMSSQVKEEVKKARSERMLALAGELSRQFRSRFLGQAVQVLLEQRKQGYWEGLTDTYVRVEVEQLPEAETRNWQNTFVTVRLEQLTEDGARGMFLGEVA